MMIHPSTRQLHNLPRAQLQPCGDACRCSLSGKLRIEMLLHVVISGLEHLPEVGNQVLILVNVLALPEVCIGRTPE